MPDVYHKGQPHEPRQTVAGNFLGMHPAASPTPDHTKEWYRADEVAEMHARSAKYRLALQAVMAIFEDPNESGDSDTTLKILDIVERALK